ncbi:hypothetical protein [Pedobacter flavus]|uniref:Uncharacterized protein n=1 Tax=Pedobacter flavus TaxID=3113906 RepID=A0ABU7H213_9SPHI|nr:hypothetical protein [Pedobacter sp. VNH31]MEE1885357.1 hypothetical protein [Pedobacter sp. VNH31]
MNYLFKQIVAFLSFIIATLSFSNLYAQENYRLIKSDYFLFNREFQEYIKLHKLPQTSVQEGDFIHTVVRNKSNQILLDLYTSDFKKNVTTSDELGTYSTSGFSEPIISPYAEKPSTIVLGGGDYYVGYLEAGSYYTGDGLIFTGFMLPTLKEFGNGSVLFMEDTKNKKCAWTLIVDGNIDWTIPANYSEKPDVERLHQDFNRDYKIISDLPRIKLHLKEKENPVSNEFMSELAMVNIQPKNNTNFSGYGLLMNQKSKNAVADEVQVFVGQFKNSVLHGMGYYATVTNTFKPTSEGKYREIQITEQSVHAMFGYFKQNRLLQGRTINAQNQPKDIDFWSATNYPGILYSKYDKGRKILFPESQYLSGMPEKVTIYLPSIDREFVAIVDKSKGVLRIKSDYNTEDKIQQWQYIDGKKELVYYQTKNSYTTNQSCPKEVKKPIYGTKKEAYVAYNEFSHIRQVTKGVYYNREYNTSSITPVYKTKEVSYFTGQYSTETCPYCNGTGKAQHFFNETVYKPIDFDLPQSEILMVFGLHTQNLYSKENYMSAKTQMIFSTINKKPDELNLTVQMVDELTRNQFGENEQAKTNAYADIVDELVFFEEPEAAALFLRYFAPVRRVLIIDILNPEAKNYLKNTKW